MGVPLHEPRRTCREPDCEAVLTDHGRSGFCDDHYRTAGHRRKNSTSDGVHTNRPKLTADQVSEARRMRAAFKTQREIAAHFGVSVSTIQNYLYTGKGRTS